MADVTISGLPDLTPASDTYVALSNGTTTGRALTNSLPGLTPVGGIIMWSGLIAAIPANWALCNGTNGTPNLTNRFIIGASEDNAGVANTNITGAGTQTGGSKDAVVVEHTHAITDPGHVHVLTGKVLPNPYVYSTQVVSQSNSSATSIITNPSTNSATTGITINSQGSSGTNANLPPYYALAYIMRIS